MKFIEVSKIKIGRQYRNFTIIRSEIDVEKRVVPLSFSSEEPVDRWWGREILDHKKASVNLRRLKRGGALLIDHDITNQVGVIEKVFVDEDDRKGRAMVRFGRSSKAEEIFQDVLDEIRVNVSVGYQVNDMVLEEEKKNEPSTYRVTSWEPYEISLVSVPADITVGVGRSSEEDIREISVKKFIKEDRTMEKCEVCGAELENGVCRKCSDKDKNKNLNAIGDQRTRVEVGKENPPPFDAVKMEQSRKKAIANLCIANKIPDNIRDGWIAHGLDLEEVSEQILRLLEARGVNPNPNSRLDLTQRETQQYSIRRAILACIDKDWRNAPFELDCTKEIAKRINKVIEPTKFYVPFEVLERPVDLSLARSRRDISVASGGGAYLVSTDNVGFIEILRNRSVAFRMGVRRLSGLVGNVTIPKMTASGTAYWIPDETSAPTESQPTFVQVALTPKNVGAYTEISRQLLLQSSPGVEGIVSDDLAQIVAIAADLGILVGTGGAGQPRGIVNTAGIGAVTGTSLAAGGIIEFQTDVAGSNVIPLRPGYVTTPAVAGLLMVRPELPTTGQVRLWKGNIWDGTLFDLPAMTTNQMVAATMLFGDWQEVVVGEWGILEVEVNPYANFAAGIIGVRALYTMDMAMRRPGAFAYAHTIT